MNDDYDLKERYDTHDGILMFSNPYGYRVNIAHPAIRPLYERFHRWKGVSMHFPLSDAERFEFEEYILKKLEKATPMPLSKKES